MPVLFGSYSPCARTSATKSLQLPHHGLPSQGARGETREMKFPASKGVPAVTSRRGGKGSQCRRTRRNPEGGEGGAGARVGSLEKDFSRSSLPSSWWRCSSCWPRPSHRGWVRWMSSLTHSEGGREGSAEVPWLWPETRSSAHGRDVTPVTFGCWCSAIIASPSRRCVGVSPRCCSDGQ